MILKNFLLLFFIFLWPFVRTDLPHIDLGYIEELEPRPEFHELAKFMVHIKSKGRDCTGCIIGFEKIITTAHCVEDAVDPNDIRISFACLSRGECEATDQHLSPIEIRKHPSYNKTTYEFDIAVLVLGHYLHINEITRAIIPLGAYVPPFGTNCTIVFFFRNPEPDFINYIHVDIGLQEDCRNRTDIQAIDCLFCVSDQETSGKNENTTTCVKDFEGVLIRKQRLIGLAAGIEVCEAQKLDMALFTDLSCAQIWLSDYEDGFANSKFPNSLFLLLLYGFVMFFF